jgi:hypothetical protein
MSSFLFNRRTASEERQPSSPEQPFAQIDAEGILQAQAITASAIFAMLVSKGVLSADEAADYMGEIASVLRRDVDAPLGATAGNMLSRYGQALVAADG